MRMAVATSVASQALRSMRTVVAYNLQANTVEAYVALIAGPRRILIAGGHAAGVATACANMSLFGMFALAFWYGGTLVVRGELTLPQMMKVGCEDEA